MSGHSKWATIKRKKGAADARRGKAFTKLIREISTSARLGGADVDANPRLRLAVEKARGANMPKDNIERAIQKGIGGGEGDGYEEVVYEGYGPGGVAIYVEALTDNRRRTVGEVRHLLGKHGGNLGSSGCVSYLFDKRGVVRLDAAGVDTDALLEAALEAGAEDVVEDGDAVSVVTEPGGLQKVHDALAHKGYHVTESGVEMEPTTTVALSGSDAQAMLQLADALDDLDDVQHVYANFDIPDEEMAQFA